MKRSERAELAQQTLLCLERGGYQAPSGQWVDLSEGLRECLGRTCYAPPSEVQRARRDALATEPLSNPVQIEVYSETTLQGIAALTQTGADPVGALNFASAKNPGGGFLNGSQAQEESLARSSALYASLLLAPGFYDAHRASSSLFYSDAMIVSPDCPIFRDDAGCLLETPYRATFLTCAAPNAGAMRGHPSGSATALEETFERRCDRVLAMAARWGCRHLVLGAWGCGVFRNDPAMVARAFAVHLKGLWRYHFVKVRFSIYEPGGSGPIVAAFRDALEMGEPERSQ
jgi:uncharacterized protein (TIGR02452 family)